MNISAQKKLQVVKLVNLGIKTVGEVALEIGVARKTVYKWVNKYNQAGPRNKAGVFSNTFASGDKHPKAYRNKLRAKLVKLIAAQPELSLSEYAKKMNAGRHAVYNLFVDLDVSTPDKRKQFSQKYQRSGRLEIDIKKDVIDMVRSGKSVAWVAKEYLVSRKTIYKWLSRYDTEGHVAEKYVCGTNHPRSLSLDAEKKILAVIADNAELSIHRISADTGVSSHGVWNLLNKYGLTQKWQRQEYAAKQSRVEDGFIPTTAPTLDQIHSVFETFVPQVAPAPPPQPQPHFVRMQAGKPVGVFTNFLKSLGIGTSLGVFVGMVGWLGIRAMGTQATGAGKTGMMFAMFALACGMAFFAYSVKYYLTIGLVLSFSQSGLGLGISANKKNKKDAGLMSRLLNGYSSEGLSRETQSVLGMQADLSGVSLSSYPHISLQVPFYNERHVVERAIGAALAQDYPSYEVILCDDSTDETTRIIENYMIRLGAVSNIKHPISLQTGEQANIQSDGYTITQVEVRPGVVLKHLHRTSRSGYKGGALALALQYTNPQSQYISIFDADFVPYADSLTLFAKYFQMAQDNKQTNIAAVQGYQWHVLNKSENWITRGVRTEYSGSYVIERAGTEIYNGLKQISGSVYMISKQVLEEIGWGTSITEDFELTLRLYEKGYKVLYTPYIQAPAECVSTLKRLIRQRMRWAEGHSQNIKKMFAKLMTSRNLQASEKAELLFLAPYYLQAAVFLIGTICWFISEAIFQVRLPFWTALWGWSLVISNLVSLPLMNGVGVFLEEGDQRDYLGLASFIALSYIVVPFQAYAAIKGFIETQEGPWFRTPKTGRVTDVLNRNIFARFIRGLVKKSSFAGVESKYLTRQTASYAFDSFITRAHKGNKKLVGRVMWSLVAFCVLLGSMAKYVPVVYGFGAQTPRLATVVPVVESQTRTWNPKQPENKDTIIRNATAKEITNDRLISKEGKNGEKVEFIFAKEPKVRIKVKGSDVTFTTDKVGDYFANPTKAKMYADDQVVYEEIAPGVDLQYKVEGLGLVEEFVLKNESSYKFELVKQRVDLEGASVVSPDPSAFMIVGTDGKELLSFGSPFAKDVKGEINQDITYTLSKDAAGYTMVKKLGQSAKDWVRSELRSYPVIVDPTVIVSGGIEEGETQYGGLQRKVQAVSFSPAKFGGTFANDTSIGTVAWTNPSNAGANDSTYATATINASTTQYLKATNFGFTLPTNVGVTGIMVEVDRSLDNNSAFVETSSVRLVKAGTIVGNTKTGLGQWSTVETLDQMGSSSDLWGTTWSESDLENTGFGVVVSATEDGTASAQAQIDYITITVYYTAWYAIYNCDASTCTGGTTGGKIYYKKSADGGVTWESVVDVDSSDSDNYNPSISYNSGVIHVWWIDDGSEKVEGRRIDTTNSDTLGTLCTSATAQTSIGNTFMVSVAAFGTASAMVAFSDTSTDTEVDIYSVSSLDGSCSVTDVQPGNMAFGTGGSGVTSSDRPVLVQIDGNSVAMIFQDGDLSYSLFDSLLTEWRSNNQTIVSDNDTVYSVTTDGSKIWVLMQNGTASADLFSLTISGTDIVETQVDSDAGANGDDSDSDINMFCPTEDNCKIVYTDDIDTTAPKLRFVDCNDADCTAPTITQLDADIGAANDQAGADIYCVSDGDGIISDNCKVIYGDNMDTTTPDLTFVDCTNDEDCSTNTTTATIDTDLGSSATVTHPSIYCPSDADCKIFYHDDSGDDMVFIDCSAANNCTGTARIIDGTAQTVGIQVGIDCSAGGTDCKLTYMDGDSSPWEFNFVDCDNANCGTAVAATADCAASGRTCTEIDSDVGTTAGAVATSLDCSGGATECAFIYGDTTAGDLFFVDCEDATCVTGRTITQIDATGGANTLVDFKVSLDCVSVSDCKFIYTGELTSGAEDAYFVDCDNETCTAGSAYDLAGPRFGGAVQCLTASNCKMAYYDGTTATNPTVQFADCDTEDCLAAWTNESDPWTGLSDLETVSITYDSANTMLYAHAIKDASDQAYWKSTSSSSISWSGETSYGFTAGTLNQISAPATGVGINQVGVVLNQGSNFEFATVPENMWWLWGVGLFLPVISIYRSRRKNG